jgi:hypothetical protein
MARLRNQGLLRSALGLSAILSASCQGEERKEESVATEPGARLEQLIASSNRSLPILREEFAQFVREQGSDRERLISLLSARGFERVVDQPDYVAYRLDRVVKGGILPTTVTYTVRFEPESITPEVYFTAL